MSQLAEWCPARFDQFALLQRGQDLPKTQFQSGEVPVAGSAGVIGFHNEANVKGPGVTVGRSGSCGTIRFYQTDFFAHNTALYVKDFFGNHPLYVAFFLEYFKPSRFKSGVSVPTLDRNQFRNEIVAVPEVGEQLKIARVLAMVQQAIEQQQAIIATIRELKRSLMHKLFTAGLRGEAQKPTEIGPVPVSWDIEKLGQHARVGNGSTPKRSNPDYWTKGSQPWLTSGKIHEGVIDAADEFVTLLAAKECHLPLVPAGSVLVAITGQGKTLGNAALVTFDTHINQHLAYISITRGELHPPFVFRFLQSRYEYLRSVGRAGGSTKAALTCGFLKSVLVPKPDIQEQQEIAEMFEVLDDKLALAERKRSHFEDLFKTLLHQLMTAQVRVNDLDLDTLGVPALD